MISLERRLLKAVIDDKNCHLTQSEYDDFVTMGDIARSSWMATFIPFRFFGRKIKLLIDG